MDVNCIYQYISYIFIYIYKRLSYLLKVGVACLSLMHVMHVCWYVFEYILVIR